MRYELSTTYGRCCPPHRCSRGVTLQVERISSFQVPVIETCTQRHAAGAERSSAPAVAGRAREKAKRKWLATWYSHTILTLTLRQSMLHATCSTCGGRNANCVRVSPSGDWESGKRAQAAHKVLAINSCHHHIWSKYSIYRAGQEQ